MKQIRKRSFPLLTGVVLCGSLLTGFLAEA